VVGCVGACLFWFVLVCVVVRWVCVCGGLCWFVLVIVCRTRVIVSVVMLVLGTNIAKYVAHCIIIGSFIRDRCCFQSLYRDGGRGRSNIKWIKLGKRVGGRSIFKWTKIFVHFLKVKAALRRRFRNCVFYISLLINGCDTILWQCCSDFTIFSGAAFKLIHKSCLYSSAVYCWDFGVSYTNPGFEIPLFFKIFQRYSLFSDNYVHFVLSANSFEGHDLFPKLLHTKKYVAKNAMAILLVTLL